MPDVHSHAAKPQPGPLLEARKVGRLEGDFFVASYQRGYRWGSDQVEKLLDDLWAHREQPGDYNLQPVVVIASAEAPQWELVDGQQRLTTLHLIQTCVRRVLQQAGLDGTGYAPRYGIRYETREDSANYLRNPEQPEGKHHNIDFHHIHAAFLCIDGWLQKTARDGKQEGAVVAAQLHQLLRERVNVLWYQLTPGPGVDAITIFTRLNIGRIPLTDAELFKALLLSQARQGRETAERCLEMAAQWDGIERDLRDPDVWAFVTLLEQSHAPARISLLLDVVAGAPRAAQRPAFHTFETLRKRLEANVPEPVQALWSEVVELHARVMGWYHDRNLYHRIGYLVATSTAGLDVLNAKARKCSRRAFEQWLVECIRGALKRSRQGVLDLRYDRDRPTCERLLLLMNVESVRQLKNSTERYSFRQHHKRTWSLEHIHAQQAQGLTTQKEWKAWLASHAQALRALPLEDKQRQAARAQLLDAIEQALPEVNEIAFNGLSRQVMAFFALAGDEDDETEMHSIANLALLDKDSNAALGNSVFEVKRQHILERDRAGAYIPLCTRRVFLKYYTTDAGAQQIHFWSRQDRQAYLEAMVGKDHSVNQEGKRDLGVLGAYLLQEGSLA